MTTRAVIEGMILVLGEELSLCEITVNTVAFGPNGTELFFADRSPELVQRVLQAILMGRLGEPMPKAWRQRDQRFG